MHLLDREDYFGEVKSTIVFRHEDRLSYLPDELAARQILHENVKIVGILKCVLQATAEVFMFPKLKDPLLVLDMLYLLFAGDGHFFQAFQSKQSSIPFAPHQLDDAEGALSKHFQLLEITHFLLLVFIYLTLFLAIFIRSCAANLF